MEFSVQGGGGKDFWHPGYEAAYSILIRIKETSHNADQCNPDPIHLINFNIFFK